MSQRPAISFAKPSSQYEGVLVLLSAEEGGLAPSAARHDPQGVLPRAIEAAAFKGKTGTSADLLAPHGTALDRLVVLGVGKPGALDEQGWMKIGGAVQALARKAKKVTVVLDVAAAEASATDAATLAMGILLRAYTFDKYKTRKDDTSGEGEAETTFLVACADPQGARKKFAELEGIAGGVLLARDLVNEPANILGPVEFAAKAKELEALGVEVEILDDADMTKLGMGALLGVAQGSERPARLVVMKWNGGKAKDKPIAFVGKGVVFDSGGISIKPAAGMEDMKGDMGGAAAVTGLMHALASRKAKANGRA